MSVLTLSVDPGLHGLGCGLWEGGDLVAGWYLPGPSTGPTRGPGRWRAVVEAGLVPVGVELTVHLVVEVMQIYPHMKGDPDDILEVQGVAGALSSARPWGEVTGYTGRQWKNQVPQGVLAARVEAYLTGRGWSDRLHPCPKDRRHDMLHGVGVGLHHLGHMTGGRTNRTQ